MAVTEMITLELDEKSKTQQNHFISLLNMSANTKL